jgi:hypothetical protein
MPSGVNMRAFWDISPCSLVVDRCFRGAYCLHHQGDSATRFSSPADSDTFLFSTFKPTLWPIKPPVHFVPGLKRVQHEAHHSPT